MMKKMDNFLKGLLPAGLVSILTGGFLLGKPTGAYLRATMVSILVNSGEYSLPLAEIEADKLLRNHEKEIRETILPIFKSVSDRLTASTAFCRDPQGAAAFSRIVFGR